MNIVLGIFADKIKDQLDSAHLSYDEKEISKLQKIADSISMLRIHGYITDSIGDKAYNRLGKAIQGAIK
ncbi:hypothetical protein HF670_11840 [Acidithiobacillus thiooxidans]|uniref:hypothetical protein n=1 Tax=Acidithiobacillus thiooxidans TaxID=930 RepID=UPI001C0652FB|nr:hypothetical protein [Acidithiobacillus thiooxidans]MBU2840237.1 hypothetical protein [Acidithiobacillus thiooxidans]